MSISQKSIKILWADSAGRCAFPSCAVPMIEIVGGISTAIGEMAHICGERPGASRYREDQTNEQRNSHENLILLCPNHHTLIDKPEYESEYPADRLLKMKNEHTSSVGVALSARKMDKQKLTHEISLLAAMNRNAWKEFGPLSERAMKQPHNEKYYETWRYKRLTLIVPNNRKISFLLNENNSLIESKWHATIAEFLEHAGSYEEWVRSEDEYGIVTRYPIAFDAFLEG